MDSNFSPSSPIHLPDDLSELDASPLDNDTPDDDNSDGLPDSLEGLTETGITPPIRSSLLRPVVPPSIPNTQTATEPTPQSSSTEPGLASGDAFYLVDDYNRGKYVFANTDCSMMKLYDICDKAGAHFSFVIKSSLKSTKKCGTTNLFLPTLE
jgi:hypothetical protein